jgi:BlaI family transcriptional regulator, penicillinase repressor
MTRSTGGNNSQRPPLSGVQLEIMNIVWRRGGVTVADVRAAVAVKRPVARNTIQTVMTRLEEKGWLRHRVEGKTFHYVAAVPRRSAVVRLTRHLLDTVFGGSAAGLVATLLESGLAADEAKRIRDMLDAAERGEGRP